MSKVMIYPSTYENVRQAVDRAFELFPLEIRVKSVLIKPNVLRISEAGEDRRPSCGAARRNGKSGKPWAPLPL